MESYVDKGKVRFGYWHFVFLSPESQTAAEASECAGDQGFFWEYHDMIFIQQANGIPLNLDNLKLLAAEIGLDQSVFNDCLDSGVHTEFVQQQTALANQIGVRSTPAFLINSQAVLGAQPFENFKEVIEGQLSE